MEDNLYDVIVIGAGKDLSFSSLQYMLRRFLIVKH